MADTSQAQLVVTPPFRMCFPSIVEASAFREGKPKFSVVACWRVEDLKSKYASDWKNMSSLLNTACMERFRRSYNDLPRNYKRALRDGIERDFEPFGEGTVFAKLSSLYQPGIVDRSRAPMSPDDPRVYAGCYMRASVNAYTYDNISKGVALGLQNLQWLGHGDRLSGRQDAAAAFVSDTPGGFDTGDAPRAPEGVYSGNGFIDDDDDVPF